MAKKTKLFTLLLLIPTLLTACNQNTSNKNSSSDSTGAVSSSEPSTVSSSTSEVTSSSDSTEQEITQENSPWNETITQMMVKYLGGTIVPYIELGEKIDAVYDSNDSNENYLPYIKLTGEKFKESSFAKSVENYQKYKWEVVRLNNEIIASNDDKHIKVEVSINSSNIMVAKIFYSPDFDDTTLTDWTTVTKAQLKEYFGTFNLPFIYLGTENYETNYDETSNVLTITGGIYNDSVNEEFTKAFKDGWEVGTDETTTNGVVASKTDAKGNKMVVKLDKYENKARLRVHLEEVFDTTIQDSWSTTVSNKMSLAFNEVLPYFYLGTVYPNIDTTASGAHKLVLKGKIWNDSIVSDAKAKLLADKWQEVSSSATDFTLTKVTSFGNLSVKLERVAKDDSFYPLLTVSSEEAYNETITSTYPEELKTLFKDTYTDDLEAVLPFVYLATKNPTGEVSKNYNNQMVVTGGLFNQKVVENFKTKYSQANWVVTDKTTKMYSSSSEKDGKVYAAAIKKFENATYKVGLFTKGTGADETLYLDITKTDNLSKNTSWSESSKTLVKDTLDLDLNEIPFFDTYSDGDQITLTSRGNLSLNFVATNSVNYRIINAYTALASDPGFKVEMLAGDSYYYNEVYIKNINASKKLSDGRTVVVSITNMPYGRERYYMYGTIKIDETYDLANAPKAWPKSVSEKIKSKFNGLELPYFYLGTAYPVVTEDSSKTDELNIIGGIVGETYFTDVKKQAEDNGFTITSSNSWSVEATKTMPNKDVVELEFSTINYSNSSKPELTIKFTEGFKPDTFTSYPADIDKELKETLKIDDFPLIYLNSDNPSMTVSKSIVNSRKISLLGGNFRSDVMDYLANELKAINNNEWNVNYIVSGSYTKEYEIQAYKIFADSTSIRFRIYQTEDDKIQLDIYYDPIVSTVSSTATSWSELDKFLPEGKKTLEYMKSNFFNETITPLLFLDSRTNKSKFEIKKNQSYSDTIRAYLTNSDAYYSNYQMNLVYNSLKQQGYDVTYRPFGYKNYYGYDYLPEVFATKAMDTDSTFKFTISANTYGTNENLGFEAEIFDMPSYTYFTKNSWSTSEQGLFKQVLGDKVTIPFVNLGDDNLDISVSSSNDDITITADNYKKDIFSDISSIYKTNGWDTFETIDDDGEKVLLANIKIDNRVYNLKVTYSNSDSYASTKLEISYIDL